MEYVDCDCSDSTNAVCYTRTVFPDEAIGVVSFRALSSIAHLRRGRSRMNEFILDLKTLANCRRRGRDDAGSEMSTAAD